MTDITVPTFPESVTEGTILAWRKQPGEPVRRDETLAEIETDKIVFEVPAPADGVLAEIKAPVGATVKSGEVLGRVEKRAMDGASADLRTDKTASAAMPASKPAAEPAPKAAVMPAAQRLMQEYGLDERKVPGSGKGGRILKEDVQKQIDATEAAAVTPAPKPKTKPAPSAPAPSLPAGDRPEKRVPMTRLRKRIAERLVEAQHTAAILTTFNEVNMQPVMELRTRHRERFEKEHGVRLGFMSFFVKATVEALRHFPEVNASIDGDEVVYHGFYDIGIAVSSPRGLVVPVLREPDRLTMAEIETRIRDFGERAQNAQLTLEEITGGTFTITNGGVFGSLMSTPILNPPQSAILGMHKIQDRPMAENGQVVIRPMMYLALSYDHRLVDGREAVQFLVMVKELLEDPARLLLEV
ncbi:dihydrolipoamide succinyltransferase [Sulfuricaulis limicola]|uniref:Dihydrolipoyllysine-residue succinyltransferase component of 2-oxoglutarate dehydrogenase complex n=1 Tax=Sulfuricaulis limicola TaxID=1620215 RepID=A0A1B4XC17_9GAMM|nr:2-oxoglutarate dehydrogenase complex dihydrolipoyllysine-residue succinyltransferase [Sulfuricaulis limicola]BAV32367.1 dihydrolipoamide succinyltransferase [Sulfuricaulis limicola]